MELETSVQAGDNREIELVVKHFAFVQGGIPLACDVTLVSPLTTASEAKPRAAVVDGVAITEAVATKERRYPEHALPAGGPGRRGGWPVERDDGPVHVHRGLGQADGEGALATTKG